MKKLKHANIVEFYDYRVDNNAGLIYLMMEYNDDKYRKVLTSDSPVRFTEQFILFIFYRYLNCEKTHKRMV